MLGLFKKDPTLRLKEEYITKMQKAREALKKGDEDTYLSLMADADRLVAKIDSMG